MVPAPSRTWQSRPGTPRRMRRGLRGLVGVRAGRGFVAWQHRMTGQVVPSAALAAISLLVAAGMAAIPAWVPPATVLLVVLLGVFVLRRTAILALSVLLFAEVLALQLSGLVAFTPGQLIVQAVGVVVGVGFVTSRDRLGLQGAPSQLMLVDLRDRLAAHGRIPALPPGWQVDSVIRSAFGEAFSGDFLVARHSAAGQVLEIVLVDVTGKGQEAGVRSLLLSGAFGGLLGAMPSGEFLPAANTYLLAQDWSEGFATAVHLAVDLPTGHFRVSHAGHPPAVHLHAASGLVETLDGAGGPVLGVVAGGSFPVREGVLEPGDTVVLYTDGMVEVPGRDLDLGIDRLMGVAERIVATRRGGAEAVVAGVRAGENDDRALVLVRRD